MLKVAHCGKVVSQTFASICRSILPPFLHFFTYVLIYYVILPWNNWPSSEKSPLVISRKVIRKSDSKIIEKEWRMKNQDQIRRWSYLTLAFTVDIVAIVISFSFVMCRSFEYFFIYWIKLILHIAFFLSSLQTIIKNHPKIEIPKRTCFWISIARILHPHGVWELA